MASFISGSSCLPSSLNCNGNREVAKRRSVVLCLLTLLEPGFEDPREWFVYPALQGGQKITIP